jgi:hypothetical protein
MLPVDKGPCLLDSLSFMEAKNGKKSRDILKAVAAGRSCEQILAGDGTLTYHDIFHVVTEAPTSFWRKPSARNTGKQLPAEASSARKPLRHSRD